MKIVAVTACPTGTALTYMAANRLASAGRDLGYDMKVETQGAMGIENTLTNKDVTRADVVVIAADIEVAKPERFAKSRIVKVTTSEAVEDPKGVIARAVRIATEQANS